MQPFVRAAISCIIVSLAGTSLAMAQALAAKPTADSIAKAEQILSEARKAIGGEKLAAIKTLVASGRTRRVRGNNLVPIEFEIFLELPNKYVRVDEFPAEDTDPTSSGFNGDELIQIPPPPAPGAGRGGPSGAGATPPGSGTPPAGSAPAPTGRGGAAAPGAPPSAPAATSKEAGEKQATPTGEKPGAPAAGGSPAPAGANPAGAGGRGGSPLGPGGRGPAMDPRRARTQTVKQDFARLTLGLLAASPAYPLTFSYAAVAEAPQGQADVLDAKGEGNFALRLFIDSRTRLPIMVSWTTPPTNVIVTVPGQPPPKTVAPGAVVVAGPPAPVANAPKEEADKYAKDVLAIRTKAQATPVEHRLYFADYREVDGVRFPFRLRRAIGTETTEETTFDRFRLNAKIDPRKFEAVK